ncbi:hypothetical protein Tco_0393458 [Tanacetum coccineum]
MLGSELQGEDFAKKMVDLVNQRKKFFAEERAKAKRNKPMTQSQLKTYMMNYLKNQGSWKLNHFEATKDSLKRFGEELQTKTPKRLKEDKDDEAKDDEPTKKLTKRRKQIARKGMHTSVDENVSDDSDKVSDKKRLTTVMNRYGLDGPEDKLEKGFWKCLRIMFEEPLSTDSIWSEIEQQKIVSWRYYDTSRVHCLNLESMDVYLLSDRKYPLPAEWLVSQLTKFHVQRVDMVLNPPWNLPFLGAKGLTSPEQTATGVNTPGSDENRMKLYDLMYNIVNIAEESLKTSCCQDLKT